MSYTVAISSLPQSRNRTHKRTSISGPLGHTVKGEINGQQNGKKRDNPKFGTVVPHSSSFPPNFLVDLVPFLRLSLFSLWKKKTKYVC